MQFSIEQGRIEFQTDSSEDFRASVMPRRSCHGPVTAATIEFQGRTTRYEIEPVGADIEDWTWSGTGTDATRVAPLWWAGIRAAICRDANAPPELLERVGGEVDA